MTVDCWVTVDGDRFADTAFELEAGAPTVLADLTVVWGRTDAVDQPDVATATFAVLDRTGGILLADALPIGAPVAVWASGDIGVTAPVDVAVDGTFEALPPGPADSRVAVRLAPYVTSWCVTDFVYAGAHSIAADSNPSQACSIFVPPGPFTVGGNPASWDGIPTIHEGEQWTWELTAYLDNVTTTVSVQMVTWRTPTDITYEAFGNVYPVYGNGWVTIARTVTVPAGLDGRWLGARINFGAPLSWEQVDPSMTWADAPYWWQQWGRQYIDNFKLFAPAGESRRDVLVFDGRISNVDLTVTDDAGTIGAQVTAVDQLADLMNRYIGATPWPAETVAARLGRIIAAAGVDIDQRLDPSLASPTVSWRDVDRQPAGGLITELAAGVDAVHWSAVHATTGPYVWLEDVANRAALAQLTLSGSTVIIEGAAGLRPEGRTHLDGCHLNIEPVTWSRDVSDVVNLVDCGWREQTVDESGNPAPTDRTDTVQDTAAVDLYGARRMGVNTNLTTAAQATAVGNRILARTRYPSWRVNGLTVDAGKFPPAGGTETAQMLDLLDGTIRLGRPLVVTNIVAGPAGETGAYLDGGSYLFDGAWTLELSTTPMTGIGETATWAELDPAWAWEQFDSPIVWIDLVGVAA